MATTTMQVEQEIAMDYKVVFLTGSTSGVGLHLTQRFSDAGYRVVATDIDFERLKHEAAARGWPPQSVLLRRLDVTRAEAWRSLFDEVLGQWQRVDVLCNVAGYLRPGLVHETGLEQIDRHLDVNVKGLILGSKFAAEHMVPRRSGHIINVASLAGVAPIPGIALYSTSKFAVRGFSLALAQELKPHQVAVTVICPDAIETPMLTLQEDFEEAALTFSGRRALTVEDIGSLVFDKVLVERPLEVMLPGYRGLLAKVGSAVPGLAFRLGAMLGKAGKAEQARRRGNRPH